MPGIRGFLVMVAVGLGLVPMWGVGGDYHTTGTLICSDCHVMHYSEAHTLTGPGQPVIPLESGGPFPKLLRQSVSNLCLACHDGRADVPDVLGAHAGGYTRSAGGLNKTGDGGEYAQANGHSLGSTTVPPGGTWDGNKTEGLQCKHCHDIHGNAYYRNLSANPGKATGKFVTYLSGSVYVGTAAVQQIAATPMATQYDAGNIRYRQTLVGSTDFGLAEWCAGCHETYHGAGGAGTMGGSTGGDANTGSPWLRHPSRDVTMAQAVTNKHIDITHWFDTTSPQAMKSRIPIVSPSGSIPGASGTSDNQVFCGSCHKAHGSNHRAGLIFDDETTTVAEDGSSLMQTCQQCHYQ